MAIFTSMTGLNSASTDLSVIANNVANVGSNGFKKSRAEFGDLIGASAFSDPRKTVGIGSAFKGARQMFTQGSTQATGATLDLAITGSGFFFVRTERGEEFYTRNGAFGMDPSRYVIDSTGARLQVFPTDASGVPTALGVGATRALRIPETSGSPQATTLIEATLNLPSAAAVPTAPFDRDNPASYNASTTVTVFDDRGNPLNATFYYRRLTTPTLAVPTSVWEVRGFVGTTELSTTTPPPVVPLELTFDDLGNLVAPAGAVSFDPILPPTGAGPLALALDHGALTTQFADPFTIITLDQDGFAAGRLDSVTIDSQGVVRASYTNGDTRALGKLAIADFANPQGLKQLGDARWVPTGQSGALLLGEAGTQGLGSILSGAIERSNVILTDELVNLIVAQRNFQANAKAVETDGAMTQSILAIR
jgi:flagellar hook protein FlgE